jgi:hypothetical protein
VYLIYVSSGTTNFQTTEPFCPRQFHPFLSLPNFNSFLLIDTLPLDHFFVPVLLFSFSIQPSHYHIISGTFTRL